MKKFRIKKKKNDRFCIKEKNWLWYETMLGTGDFESYRECVDYIYQKYDPKEVEIEPYGNLL